MINAERKGNTYFFPQFCHWPPAEALKLKSGFQCLAFRVSAEAVSYGTATDQGKAPGKVRRACDTPCCLQVTEAWVIVASYLVTCHPPVPRVPPPVCAFPKGHPPISQASRNPAVVRAPKPGAPGPSALAPSCPSILFSRDTPPCTCISPSVPISLAASLSVLPPSPPSHLPAVLSPVRILHTLL